MLERLYTAPPEGGIVVCLDEMGPQSARSYPGRRVVKPAPPKAQRAKQEIDYGRRGKGYVFGAFRPATGEAFTAPYTGRTTANWVDFLGAVEGWIKADVDYSRFKAQLDRVPADKLPEDKRFNPLALNPYLLYKALPNVRRYSSDELIEAMRILLECNQRLIFSNLDEALVLQQALVQIVRGANGQAVGSAKK